MHKMRRLIAIGCLSAALIAGVSIATVEPSRATFNDEYVFATTKAVNDMDANPALKVTLYPATIVLDTAFLPFAVIAGFVS